MQGGEEQGGMRFYAPSNMQSVKDIAGQTTIKYRKDGQNSLEELKRKDLRAALEDKERKHFLKASKEGFLGTSEGRRNVEIINIFSERLIADGHF